MGECILQAFGIETNSVRVAKEGFDKALAQAGPDGTVYALAHSQGALVNDGAFSSMSREQLSHIRSYTWGAAKVINNPHLKSAYNCISAGDIVPLFLNPVHCCAGLLGYGHKMNVNFVMPKEGSWPIDHAFGGKTYYEDRRNIIDQIKP